MRHSYPRPLSRHWPPMIVLTWASMFAKENSSFFTVRRPDSMRLISRMSLMMLSRCCAERPIFCRCSRVSGEMPGSFRAMRSRPMMAFIGVRISWLMLERKAVFALFAWLASSSAMLSDSRCCASSRIISFRSVMSMNTPMYVMGVPSGRRVGFPTARYQR